MQGQGGQGLTQGLIPYMEDGKVLAPVQVRQMTSRENSTSGSLSNRLKT